MMWWYVIISIIIASILLTLAWKLKWDFWLVFVFCALAVVSVYSGTWHNHFEPLHYNHLLTVSIKDENSLKSEITDYNRNDTGLSTDWHPFKHSELSGDRDTASRKMNDLKHFKAPANVSNRASKIKAQCATIRGIQYQLNRYNKLEKKINS